MNRRRFILRLCACAAALPFPARAQTAPRVVGLWWSPLQVRELLPRYRQRLAELGWVEGRNIRYEVRVWDGDTANMRRQAGELVAARPEVIVAGSNPAGAGLEPGSGGGPGGVPVVAPPGGSGFLG